MFFDDFKIDDIGTTSGRTITEADVVAFAGISGDFNAIHVNQEYAKTSTFGQRIAHGMLILSVASGLTVQTGQTTESIVAFYGIDRLRFIKPVFIGDTITVKNRVAELKVRDEKTGLVTFDTTVLKQGEEPVMVFNRKLLLLRRKA